MSELVEAGRREGWYVCRVDGMNQLVARLTPTFDTPIEAEAALEVLRNGSEHSDLTIGCDLLIRRVRRAQ